VLRYLPVPPGLQGACPGISAMTFASPSYRESISTNKVLLVRPLVAVRCDLLWPLLTSACSSAHLAADLAFRSLSDRRPLRSLVRSRRMRGASIQGPGDLFTRFPVPGRCWSDGPTSGCPASRQISQGKTRDFRPIYPPHVRLWCPDDYRASGKQASSPHLNACVVRVPRAGTLLTASSRPHLAVTPLLFG
jgi:hypothetical protein